MLTPGSSSDRLQGRIPWHRLLDGSYLAYRHPTDDPRRKQGHDSIERFIPDPSWIYYSMGPEDRHLPTWWRPRMQWDKTHDRKRGRANFAGRCYSDAEIVRIGE